MNQLNQAFKDLQHPFAWVDLEELDHNITTLSLQSKQKRVRIATKSIRSLEMLKYLSENVPYFTGWMTFTAEETVFLAENGLDHFLLGYPTLEEGAVRELCQHVKNGKDITFMVDHLEQAGWLNKIASSEEVHLKICVDLNLSLPTPFLYFGTRRSSIQTIEQFDLLIEQLTAMKNLKIAGLMGYEAQIAGVGNNPSSSFKGMIIRSLQKKSKNKIMRFRKQVAIHLKKSGLSVEFVNGGGTGSIEYTAQSDEVTEVTIGSGYFKPALFDYYRDSKLKPAAGFALRVTRKPMEDTIVCHGGGYLASGTADLERLPVIVSPNLEFYSTEGAGEVQTPLKMTSSKSTYSIGDTIYFRHAKSGELCERFNEIHLVRLGKYKGSFKTYRGDGQCFL